MTPFLNGSLNNLNLNCSVKLLLSLRNATHLVRVAKEVHPRYLLLDALVLPQVADELLPVVSVVHCTCDQHLHRACQTGAHAKASVVEDVHSNL